MNEDHGKYLEHVEVVKFHNNIAQEVVQITVDKLKIILSGHLEKCSRSNDWQAALGILLSIAATLATTDFKKSLGVEPASWKAVFIIVGGACVLWLCKSLVRLYRRESIDDLIKRIANELPKV